MTTYCRPFKRGVSWRSQNFGDNPNNGTNGAGGHTGNDDAAPIGSEVHAAGDGVVEYAGQFDETYADNLLWLIDFGGNILVLNCGDDEPTFVYAHISRFLVKPGDRVRKGQVIALSGNSGTRTTGPHCHNEAIAPGYMLNSPTLGRVNPDLYLTEWPDDIGDIAAMGSATTPLSEEDDMATPEQIWNHPMQLEGQTFTAEDILIYGRINAALAKDKAEAAPGLAVQILLSTKLKAPDGSGKEYTIADYLVFGWWYAMQAKDKPQGPPMDPTELAKAIDESAANVAARLEITLKET